MGMTPNRLAVIGTRRRRMRSSVPRGLSVLAMVLCVATGARAEQVGGVSGDVALASVKPLPLPPGYKAHTKRPIADPDAPRAIVYLARDDGAYPTSSSFAVENIAQEGYQFRPGVTAVRTGTQVAFPNHDDEFHSVFSYSKAKRFDLGRYRKDEQSPLITFDQPGVVKIYCEIHKHMRNLLLVLDTPWFTETDSAGHYALDHVPPGEYQLHAFLPSEETLDARVTIIAGKTVNANLP
jgi:plastocyanin